MKKKIYFKASLAFCLILIFFISCMSDVDLSNISKTAKIDQSIGLPIAEVNLSIRDLFTKFGLPNNIDTVSNEIYYQVNTPGEYNFKPFNLVDSIKEYHKEILPPILIPILIPANSIVPDIIENDNLSLGVNSNVIEQRVDLVKFKSSTINVLVSLPPSLASIPPNSLTVEFVFPSNKLVFDDGKNPTYTPTAFGQFGQVNLGGCTIYAAGATSIPFTIIVHIKPQNFSFILAPDTKINLELKFAEIELDQAWGLFKMKVLGSKKLTLPFDLHNYLPNAFLRFDNPQVDIHVSTNIGADLNFNLDYLKLYNSATPNIISSALFGNPQYPSTNEILKGPNILGDSTSKDFRQLNKDNGQTFLLTDKQPYPNTLDFQYLITSDPLTTSRTQNFITGDSKINFNIKTRIPMSFRGGSYYTGIDTIRNIGKVVGTSLDIVDSAVLVLKITNQIPVKAFYRMTFWKSNAANDTIASTIRTIKNDSTSGSLFSRFQLNAPETNADGTVKDGVNKSQTIQIGLNKKSIEDLKNTSFIVFKLELASEIVNGVESPVHFTTRNSFNVKLGILLKPNTTVNLGKTN